jgi:cell division protein FtsZ
MVLNLREPEDHELRARITVFGVGGAGGNAVNNMIDKKLQGVEFIAANTDAQALSHSKASRKVQLGTGVTRGLGAGSKPEVGTSAAEESLEEIMNHLDGCHMCFITAGMGGGTGTGAAPVVARVAREMGILTVGVVTKPFQFEGVRRMELAEAGIGEMQAVVDTLIVIPNQNLFQVASERTTFVEAFMMADDVLYQGVQGVTDLMVRPGMINLDFADVRSVMEEMGKAMMGTGEAEGETRAIDAAEKAIANPLLDEVSLKGARGVLINITGGYDLTLFEMDEAANRIRDEVDPNAMIKFGSAIDPEMEGRMRVSVVATGIDAESCVKRPPVETAPRRRPQATDPGMMSAVRSTQRRPEPVAETGALQRAAATLQPDRQPDSRPAGAPDPTPEVAQTVEMRAATSPSPDDIRARAEEVRQRAMAARALRDTEDRRPIAVIDDEAELFDVDRNPIDAAVLRAEADAQQTARPRAETGLAGERRPPVNPIESESRGHTARAGLFAINKLIHRVAGGGQPEPTVDQTRGSQRDVVDDDEGEIPAFLRRQAN